MRKKLFIGVFLAAALSIVAGEYVFNRSGAQDAPKKAVVEEKKDVPPPLAVPPLPGETPKDAPLTTFPPIAPNQASPAFPPLPTPTPPPLINPATTLVETNQATSSNLQIPPPVVNAATPPTVPQTVPTPAQPVPVVGEPKPPTTPTAPPQELVFPPAPRVKQDAPFDSSNYPAQAFDKPKQPTVAQEIAKIKDCPWSLQVEIVEGQTTVIATVNKKHEFKIVCKSLDLQTAKGTLKASGKVTITGDAFNGTCENLSIPLMEDRLVLEGGATVSIQKIAATVSDTKAAAFELKGETLNLRISELQREPFQQTSMRREIDANVKQAAATTPIADKEWTPYGTLRRVNMKLGNDNGVWQLEDRTGKVIATVLARVGGTLTQHEGQNISVIGATEVIDGQRYLRVTHIALP